MPVISEQRIRNRLIQYAERRYKDCWLAEGMLHLV